MKNIFKKIIAVATFIIATQTTFAQNNVGIGTNSPNASAVLDMTATDKGMLIPRMTQAQRDLISSPATGLLVYQTDGTSGFYFYNGSAWTSLSGGSGDNLGNHTATQDLNMSSKNITNGNKITTNTLNTNEISFGNTSTTIALNNLTATSTEIDATGKSFLFLKSNVGNFHTINGIAGGYDRKILYLALSAGYTWVKESTAETSENNRLSNWIMEPFAQSITNKIHLIKLMYMSSLPSTSGGRWVVIDQDL